jgi:hypothetical protein
MTDSHDAHFPRPASIDKPAPAIPTDAGAAPFMWWHYMPTDRVSTKMPGHPGDRAGLRIARHLSDPSGPLIGHLHLAFADPDDMLDLADELMEAAATFQERLDMEAESDG